MPDAIRPWCATAQYPGLARADEIEAALAAHAATFLPPCFSIIEPLCGAIFFAPEAEP